MEGAAHGFGRPQLLAAAVQLVEQAAVAGQPRFVTVAVVVSGIAAAAPDGQLYGDTAGAGVKDGWRT